MNNRATRHWPGALLACLLACAGTAAAQEAKTVIGPRNIDLAAGADLLKSGDAEKGLERTLEGLQHAASVRERVAGNSNACAGYVMLDQPENALPYCDIALEIRERHWRARVNRAHAYLKLGRFSDADADLTVAEDIAPGSRSVKLVRAMYLDATDPVAPHVVVDDRRQVPDDK